AYRRAGHRNMDLLTVLPSPYRVEVFDALASGEPLQDLGLLVLPPRRNQERDRLADDLVRGVAKEAVRAFVPARDEAIERFADDAVVGRVHDGGETESLLVGFFALGNAP